MKTNDKKLIAQIVPAIKLPKEITQVFSYEVPKKFEKRIKVGAIANIPFRKKNVWGVVYNIKKEKAEEKKYKLKNIKSLLDDSTSLSKQQIELAEHISSYYYTPLSLVIKTIIPTITKNKPRKEIKFNLDCKIASIKKTEANKLLKKIKEKEKTLLVHNLQSERHWLYLETIKNETKKSKQALILLPESFDVYNFTKFYIDKFSKGKVAILTSELTKNQYFDQWKKIKKGSAQIVIGTRQAVFAPFKNLKLVIADDEHNSSYKQWDQNPRYHGITVAEKLAEIWKAKIILSSPAPSVESYYKARNETFSKIEFWRDKEKKKQLEIIDIDTEHKKGNYSVLSESLKNDLLNKIYEKRQAIIFIPRLGSSTATQCRDCGYLAECKNCHSTLIIQNNFLYCARCKEKVDSIKECPECKGQNLSSFGCGSEKVEDEIKKLFKNKNIKISRLDSKAILSKTKQLKIYKDFINKKIDVLVGTQMVLKNWNLENLSLLAILFPEIILNQPDFRSKEKSFQFLKTVYNSASEKLKIIIQTYKPDNNIFKLAADKNVDQFYEEELENRKGISNIGYPPFSKLIKLMYKEQNPYRCKKEAESLYEKLKNKISGDENLKKRFEIFKPLPAANYKEHGKYRWNIIIKSAGKDIELRDSLLNCAKKDWIIDIDPDET
jgi:primosomal protein N' (replication factor Y)